MVANEKKLDKQVKDLEALLASKEKEAAEMEDNLHALLAEANDLLDSCNAQVASTDKMREEESVCPTFLATDFKCENHGRCRVRINSYDDRAEPYCTCRRGFYGRTCSKEGEPSANPECVAPLAN